MDNAGAIIQEWGLDTSLHSKEEILAALARRIGNMLLQDPVGFIQLMYRLDIPEVQLDAAMDAPEAPMMIAELVWARQQQKVIMRKSTPPRGDADDELAW